MKAKLVYESISFQREVNPKKLMGIGTAIFSDYTLMKHYISGGSDVAIKRLICHEMKLSKNKIYFLGDTRDRNSEYLEKITDYIMNSELTESTDLEGNRGWMAHLDFFDTENGKAAVVEFSDHAEYFGDFNLFRYFKTNENIEV